MDKSNQTDCDCVIDADFDKYPKIYHVEFKVYGIDSQGIRHLVIDTESLIAAINIDDISTQLKKSHLNVEFNANENGEMYHTVGQEVVIHSAELIGVLSYMTTMSKAMFDIQEDQE